MWFETYLNLEPDAQVIRVYEPCHIPGLLQTADYARAVIRHGNPDDPAGAHRPACRPAPASPACPRRATVRSAPGLGGAR
ncbi:MAG TPA: Scr1 family TA system antitoxin-like transcriptional regulator [Trebonia sp.]